MPYNKRHASRQCCEIHGCTHQQQRPRRQCCRSKLARWAGITLLQLAILSCVHCLKGVLTSYPWLLIYSVCVGYHHPVTNQHVLYVKTGKSGRGWLDWAQKLCDQLLKTLSACKQHIIASCLCRPALHSVSPVRSRTRAGSMRGRPFRWAKRSKRLCSCPTIPLHLARVVSFRICM